MSPEALAFGHPVLGSMERGGVEAEGGGKAGESLSAPLVPLNSKSQASPSHAFLSRPADKGILIQTYEAAEESFSELLPLERGP